MKLFRINSLLSLIFFQLELFEAMCCTSFLLKRALMHVSHMKREKKVVGEKWRNKGSKDLKRNER